MAESADQDRLRRYWEKHSRSYYRDMRFLDWIPFGESRDPALDQRRVPVRPGPVSR